MSDPKRHVPSDANARIWMVTFTDLLALLLTFFVLMFSMSQVRMDSWRALVNTMTDRLNPKRNWVVPTLVHDRQAARVDGARASDLDYLERVLTEKLTDSDALADVLVRRMDDRLVLSLPGDLLFADGGAELNAAAAKVIAALGELLHFVSNRLDLVGHATPPKGETAPDGRPWRLSVERASALAEALAEAGYRRPVRVVGLGASRFYDLAPGLDVNVRERLGNRVDVLIREAPAGGQTDAL